VKICVGYHRPETGDQIRHYWEGDAYWFEGCQPVYIEMPGWKRSLRGVRQFTELPSQAQDYVHKVEELVGVPVRYVSVGPGRDETIGLPA